MNKQLIIKAAKEYMSQTGLTQQEMATKAGMSSAYLSVMLGGKEKLGNTVIVDKHWAKLAGAAGLVIGGGSWPVVLTPQMKRLIHEVEMARKRRVATTIIAPTGSGKTYVLDKYRNKYPKHTYLVTMDSMMTRVEVLNELLHQLGLPQVGTQAARYTEIIMKLRDIANSGGEPIVIFDEAENVKPVTMQMLKGFYDRMNDKVAIVLVGTDQLPRKMQSAKVRNIEAGPQFWRRYMAGMKTLPELDKTFSQFFDEMGIVDGGLRKLVCNLCEDYGMLNRYLAPVVMEAAKIGEPITEDLFREYHNMPAAVRRA